MAIIFPLPTIPPKNFSHQVPILSPITGSRLENHTVENSLFTSGALGEGCAVRINGSTLFAPAEAHVEAIPETGYEVLLRATSGLKIWIKISGHTHHLMGEKCHRLVAQGDHVMSGTPLLHINPVWLKSKGIDPICLVMVRNIKSIRALVPAINKRVVALEDPLYELYF